MYRFVREARWTVSEKCTTYFVINLSQLALYWLNVMSNLTDDSYGKLFGFINWVDNVNLATVKRFENWRFERKPFVGANPMKG